jgi:hypothetical protein
MDGQRSVIDVYLKGWPAICDRPKSREKPILRVVSTPARITAAHLSRVRHYHSLFARNDVRLFVNDVRLSARNEVRPHLILAIQITAVSSSGEDDGNDDCERNKTPHHSITSQVDFAGKEL